MTTPLFETQATLEDEILAHVELYRLTIAAVVARIVFSQGSAESDGAATAAADILAQLVRQGRLAAHKLPGPKGEEETYYVLPPTKSSKRTSDAQGVNFDLQTLWFCALSETPSYRLSLQETRRIFPRPPHHHVRHVVTEQGDGPYVLRIYPTSVDVKSTIANLKKFIAEARSKHQLGEWIDAGDYGFCVLADHPQKVERIAEAVIAKRPGAAALAELGRIEVAFAPTAVNVAEALGQR
jgi:hypothetical protein